MATRIKKPRVQAAQLRQRQRMRPGNGWLRSCCLPCCRTCPCSGRAMSGMMPPFSSCCSRRCTRRRTRFFRRAMLRLKALPPSTIARSCFSATCSTAQQPGQARRPLPHGGMPSTSLCMRLQPPWFFLWRCGFSARARGACGRQRQPGRFCAASRAHRIGLQYRGPRGYSCGGFCAGRAAGGACLAGQRRAASRYAALSALLCFLGLLSKESSLAAFGLVPLALYCIPAQRSMKSGAPAALKAAAACCRCSVPGAALFGHRQGWSGKNRSA